MNPIKIYRSGFVQRYHQNPEMAKYGQTNAAHQWGVAMLIKILEPNASPTLLMFALTHDVGEIDVGDLAEPFKRENPEFADRHEILENFHRRKTLGDVVTPDKLTIHESELFGLCDKLEAILFVGTVEPELLKKRGWPEMIDDVLRTARTLGCGITVEMLIESLNYT